MLLFQETEPIREHKAFTKTNNIKWFTWSDPFLKECRILNQRRLKIKKTNFLYLKNHKEYNYTYSVNLSKLDKEFTDHFRHYAASMYHFSPGEEIIFFNNLINDRINGKLLHFIFSLFRSLLVNITGDEMEALYSPLSSGKSENDFPLHCDLYIPKILFNVYENVAADNSGHSIFLKLETFFNIILPGIPSFDKKKIKYLSDLVYKNEHQDNYTKFFGILYDDEKCANQIKELQKKHRLKIRLRKGEGYILNDRIWMHGRDKTNGGISSKRLHRLIYDDFQSGIPLTI